MALPCIDGGILRDTLIKPATGNWHT